MARPKAIALGASVLLVLGGLASLAQGEVSQKQGVRVTVNAGIAPKRLPRKGSAPVAVSVKGDIKALGGPSALPQLQHLSIAINGAGHQDANGIPPCRTGHITPSPTQEPLAPCRSSLIGEGSFSANVVLP